MCSVKEGKASELLFVIQWVDELQLENVDSELYSKRVPDTFTTTKDFDECSIFYRFILKTLV
jgi:hypothetical protein